MKNVCHAPNMGSYPGNPNLCFAIMLLVFGLSLPAFAIPEREAVEKALASPVIKGGKLYKTHCLSCHGEKGQISKKDPKSRNFKKTGYYARIIAKGKNEMPPWEKILSKKDIHAILSYMDILDNPEKRGMNVFRNNCIQCHGVKADGKGPAAKLYNPPPANLTTSDKNDQYKEMIIRMGGAAMGRSKVMPSWEKELSNQEIQDLVTYLRTLL